MKFDLAINLERADNSLSMKDVKNHTLEMVQMADQSGFNIVWAAEHHALEMTIAPNPFQIITWWAENTHDVRLGTAVAAAELYSTCTAVPSYYLPSSYSCTLVGGTTSTLYGLLLLLRRIVFEYTHTRIKGIL